MNYWTSFKGREVGKVSLPRWTNQVEFQLEKINTNLKQYKEILKKCPFPLPLQVWVLKLSSSTLVPQSLLYTPLKGDVLSPRSYSVNSLRMIVPFMPPNPKELDMAILTFPLRAKLGT